VLNRTAIYWSLVLACFGLSVCPPIARGQQPTPRVNTELPESGSPLPIPKVPIVPGFGNDPPRRPELPGTSTSLQIPKELPAPPVEGGTGNTSAPPNRNTPERPTNTIDSQAENRLPVGSRVTLPETARQLIRFGPRYGTLNNAKSEPMQGEKGGQRVTYLGGLIVDVEYLEGTASRRVQFAADNVVMWIQGIRSDFDLSRPLSVDRPNAAEPPKKTGEKEGEKADEQKRVSVEMYLSGNVVIRTRSDGGAQGPVDQILRADEIFYDVQNSKAIAVQADLETKIVGQFDSVHIRGREIWQLGRHEFRSFDALTYSSKRPADPALVVATREATLTESNVVRRNIFGRPYRNARTGEPDIGYERTLVATENRVKLAGIPISYFPKYTTDINDPGGPLAGIGFRSDRIFGLFQAYTTWDLFKLLGLRGADGNQWLLNLDYLSLRGMGVGTDFFYRDLFGSAYKNVGNISVYGLYDDKGVDLLGGFRGTEPRNPYFRGRLNWTHNQDLFEEGTTFTRYTGQLAYFSDKNFYEQFYKLRFDQDRNQETFAYLYGAVGNFAWSGLGQIHMNRPWVTETAWLPRADAALIGQSFFDTLVYTGRATAGYARFQTASQEAISQIPSEASNVNTLRAGVYQRLSLPFDVGPSRVEPYGVMDLTAYSQDTTGSGRGRFYGGGGVKASVPFSKLYADVQSELFNVRGLNHKVELTANYFVAQSDTDPNRLPLLDRLNDDASDLSFRSFRRFGAVNRSPNGGLFRDSPSGIALTNSSLFDPVLLANRRLIQDRPEVLNDIQVLRTGIRQRWQTKRGPEGNDHTVDWMALDLSASFFPDRVRDNFGQSLGQLEYNFVWNAGDRTAINSSGWFDPHQFGTRYFNVGVYFNRPDGSNVYFGYRHTDPIGSRVFLAVLGYQFSRKYSISLANAFDLSNNFAQSSNIAFNRTGTDVTMSLGLSYNAFQNNLGVQFLLIPNAAVARRGQSVGNLFIQ
jgi:hypothetical protein